MFVFKAQHTKSGDLLSFYSMGHFIWSGSGQQGQGCSKEVDEGLVHFTQAHKSTLKQKMGFDFY